MSNVMQGGMMETTAMSTSFGEGDGSGIDTLGMTGSIGSKSDFDRRKKKK